MTTKSELKYIYDSFIKNTILPTDLIDIIKTYFDICPNCETCRIDTYMEPNQYPDGRLDYKWYYCKKCHHYSYNTNATRNISF
jgi:hypothetical protein